MKRNLIAVFASVVLAAAMFTGCGKAGEAATEGASAQQGTNTMTKLGPEFTSAYICPMHCEGSGSDKPGKCPVCDMDYRPNPDLPAAKKDSTGH